MEFNEKTKFLQKYENGLTLFGKIMHLLIPCGALIFWMVIAITSAEMFAAMSLDTTNGILGWIAMILSLIAGTYSAKWFLETEW